MPLSAYELACGAALPAVTAGLFWTLWQWFAAELDGSHHAGAWALFGGWLAAYGALTLGPWLAETHWHWLPLAVGLAAVIGPVTRAAGVGGWERAAVLSAASITAAMLLVPTWADLTPTRGMQIALWSGVMAVSAVGLDTLTARLRGPALPAVLSLTMTCGAAVLGLSGNLRFAQSLGAGAAALGGVAVVATRFRDRTTLPGTALPWAVLVAGAMLCGRVNSFTDVPLGSYLLIPIAPLALAPLLAVRLSSLRGWKRWCLLVPPVLVAALAVVLAVLSDTGGDEW